jgi:CDP-diacylglycerol--glycerol-3-phosphate 3-phosphatidyltransferase
MRITANQVTIARLVALPVLPICLYGDERTRIFGVFVGTLIGITDALDGWLARKQGPTVLGSLLDPVADKVFIVVCYTPFAAIGGMPWWVGAAILSRELGVTVLRSSLELVGRRLPSGVVAKTKTWVQMIGFALLVLIPILAARGRLAALFGIPLGVLLAIVVPGRLFKGRRWLPLWFAAASFAGLVAAGGLGGGLAARNLLLLIIVGITWFSAADYLDVGVRELARIAPRRGWHWLRLAGGVLLPVVALALVRGTGAAPTSGAPIIPVMVLLAVEMSRGAVDNYVANRGVADFLWTLNLCFETALLVVALAVPAASPALAAGAAVVAVVGMLAAIVRAARAGIHLT